MEEAEATEAVGATGEATSSKVADMADMARSSVEEEEDTVDPSSAAVVVIVAPNSEEEEKVLQMSAISAIKQDTGPANALQLAVAMGVPLSKRGLEEAEVAVPQDPATSVRAVATGLGIVRDDFDFNHSRTLSL